MLRFFTAALLLITSIFFTACSGNPQSSNANASASSQSANKTSDARSPKYEGFQDDINCYGIIGWAWDMRRPNDPVEIEIYDGDTLLGTVTANLFRQDLLDAYKGNGAHAFNFAVPAQLRDGKTHTIRARIAGTKIDLTYTLKQINCKPD